MSERLITKKDVIKGWAKYYLCAEVSSGFERLTAPAFSFGASTTSNGQKEPVLLVGQVSCVPAPAGTGPS